MDLFTALNKVETLANGVDPNTGEVFQPDSPYNQPDVIRALYTVLTAAKPRNKVKKTKEQKQQENVARGLPKNAGLPWTEEGRQELIEQFNAGGQFNQLAELHERTQGSIIAELKKQGLIQDA